LLKFIEQALFRALADDRRKRLFESPYATSLVDEDVELVKGPSGRPDQQFSPRSAAPSKWGPSRPGSWNASGGT
jgi:hypothetical protein